MEIKQLREKVELLREILLVIGLFIGAAWAIFLFVAEKRADLAELNQNKLTMENISFNDQWLPNLDIRLDLDSRKSSIRPGFYIRANAVVTNQGKLKGEFKLGKTVYAVYAVTFDDKGKPRYGEAKIMDEVSMPGSIEKAMLLPTEKSVFPFIHYTEREGLYYVEFAVEQSLESMAVWPSDIIKSEKEYAWVRGEFIEVGGTDE